MFTESAELYDAIYARFKDYPQEARDVAALIRRTHPHARSILDVACGTGEHARLLATEHRFDVDGLDLDAAFVRIARTKHPEGRFTAADMADFRLDRRYDVVLCLFSSIGYLVTLERVGRALDCFREHLAPGGVVIVEPWFPPGVLDPERVDTRTAEVDGVRIERIGRTEIDGCVSRIHFDYEIRGPGGTRRASEVHELGLFTTGELLRAFDAAGLIAEHDAHGLTGRGLIVARAER